MRTTPLHARHQALGATMAPFAGFEMPIRYGRVTEEHRHVRAAVGLFDVSHMGELRLVGPGALSAGERLFTNHLERGLPENAGGIARALYGTLLRPDGGILDDVIAYPSSPEDVLFCINASNVDKIRAWFEAEVAAPVEVRDESDEVGQIAVQGPQALALVRRTLVGLPDKLGPMRFVEASFEGTPLTFATTGYTGERGGEIFAPAGITAALWDALCGHDGGELSVRPIGLGARDTLRLEKGFCLYGNDIDEATNPIEAGLGWTVKMDKGDFIGRGALVAALAQGPARKLRAVRMEERGIPRQGYAVTTAAGPGLVTSGSLSPMLDAGIGLAYLPPSVEEGAAVEVLIHQRPRRARVVPLPFV